MRLGELGAALGENRVVSWEGLCTKREWIINFNHQNGLLYIVLYSH